MRSKRQLREPETNQAGQHEKQGDLSRTIKNLSKSDQQNNRRKGKPNELQTSKQNKTNPQDVPPPPVLIQAFVGGGTTGS